MKSDAVVSRGATNTYQVIDRSRVNEQMQSWQMAALIGVMGLTVVLRFFRLDQQGFGNLYYAAGIQSMLRGWHNFFFVAFDSRGFLAIDKPPLGLWVQAVSVMLFGWSGWSLLFPQALAGTLSVGVLFVLVRRSFGTNAGLLAALVMALTPVAVATDRNNTMDSLLLLVLLLAALCVGVAAKSGRLWLLLIAAVLLGVGFNIKMMQAFLPLPAFCLWYLAAAPREWRRRGGHLVLAGVVVGLVSLPWILAVDLTPASKRPFITSSSNSELDLVLGHNGAARVIENPLHAPTPLTSYVTDEIGFPGPLRMWQQQLGGQVSWLLPIAVIGLLVAFWKPFGSDTISSRSDLLMWGTWLVLELLFFSVGRKFHRYYLVMLGPPIAALVGIGLVGLWRNYHAGGWRSWLLPFALLATAATQVGILHAFPESGRVLVRLVMGVSILVACTLVVLRWRSLNRWAVGVVAAGMAALLVAPTVWAVTPLWGADPSQPFAGPELLSMPLQNNRLHSTSFVNYLRDQQQGEHYIAATIRANTAAPIMLESGDAIMTLGGYSGGDHILTPKQFAARVAAKDVRFVLLPNKTNEQPELKQWVTAHCAVVPPTAWGAGSNEAFTDEVSGPHTLFDCRQ